MNEELHENSRLVCARAAKTGTHIASNNCQRYDDLQRKKKAANKEMYDYQSAPCFDDPLRCPSR